MSDAENAQLVASLLGTQVLPPELHAALLARSAGNHLYTREYVTMLTEASEACMAYITQHCPDPGKAVLAGNSVGQDKLFLTRDLPAITDHLHYRIVDVSTLKELARRWYPKAYFQAPAKTGGHRALGDIVDSINELRYYRSAVMVPAPGPDSSTAQRIAAGLDTVQA